MLTDDQCAMVLALVRHYVAQTSLVWVGSHVQMRGKRHRGIEWDGTRYGWPHTYTHVDYYQRWLPGRKKILRSLALTCKQDLLYEPNPGPCKARRSLRR
jgi:hypothetical protein